MMIKMITFLVAVVAMQNIAVAAPINLKSQQLPKAVDTYIQRYDACFHYAGEFNGDRSARDAKLNRQMTKLHCDTLEKDEHMLRKKYAKNKQVSAAFMQLE